MFNGIAAVKMRKVNYFLFVVMAMLCVACVEEPSLSDSGLAVLTAGENENGTRLLSLMRSQKGSYERFSKLLLSDEKPLFGSAALKVSERYGLHYSVPYVNKNGMVTGCVLYPLDETLPHEQQMPAGQLGVPVRMDVQMLNEHIPVTERYLYSVPFCRWEEEGFEVDGRLTEFVRLLNKGPLSVETEMQECAKTRGMEVYPGGYISLHLYYYYDYYTDTSGGGLTTVTLDLDKLLEKIDHLFRPANQNPLYYWFMKNVHAYSDCTMMDIGYLESNMTDIKCEDRLNKTFWELEKDPDYRRLRPVFTYTYSLYPRHGTNVSGGTYIGGSGGGGGTPSTPLPDLSVIDGIVRDAGGLSEFQQLLLKKAIEEAKENNCYIDKILSYLSTVGFKFDEVVIDPSFGGQAGTAVVRDSMGNIKKCRLKFQEVDFIQASSFSHELIHLFQTEQGMYKNETVRGMMEYERVLMDDIFFYTKSKGNHKEITDEDWGKKLDTTLLYSRNEEKANEYKCWLKNITQNGLPASISNDDLKKWISLWSEASIPYSTDRGYRYDVEYLPKALNKLLDLSKNCFK